MSPFDFAGGLLMGLLAFWLLGGLVARVGGLLLVLVGAANLAFDPGVGAALLIGAGATIWLFGHWHYALRHHAYKSPLARYVFCCCCAPAWLDPARSWAVPVVGAKPTDSEKSQGERSAPLGRCRVAAGNRIDLALLRGFLKRSPE